jgi:hypothetical protein
VLFAFDPVALPIRQGVSLELHAASRMARPVLARGAPGTPDAGAVAYYGTVIRIGDELRMWYLGEAGNGGRWRQRLLLATSRDGIHWTRPELGLVAFNGNTRNNICRLPVDSSIATAVVLHEPDDPDPARRFKLTYEARDLDRGMSIAFSPDGLTWTPSPNNPVIPGFFQQSGLTRIGNAYCVNGQAEGVRRLVSFTSTGFEAWRPAGIGFRRDTLAGDAGGAQGPQVHLGAALWNRGNVVLGVYGMWNGDARKDDVALVRMDLGLLVSHDGLHYVEPVPDFPLVAAGGGHRALMQGQGFENIGDETLFWYSPWPERLSDGVYLARWPRDRLGCLRPTGQSDAFVISQPVAPEAPAVLSLNVGGIGGESRIVASLVREDLSPIDGYAARDCAPIGNGFDQPVCWSGGDTIPATGPVRLRLDFRGPGTADLKFHAAYFCPAPKASTGSVASQKAAAITA